jgi:hypothetical protein
MRSACTGVDHFSFLSPLDIEVEVDFQTECVVHEKVGRTTDKRARQCGGWRALLLFPLAAGNKLSVASVSSASAA